MLEVWETGVADGRPVFFLPGCPDSRWAAWPGAAAAQRAGVRLVSVNRAGYGGSTRAGDGTVAADLLATADRLGIGTFGLVGMSVGGVYALATAASYPARVTSVVTVSSPGEVVSMRPPQHRDGLPPAAVEQLAEIARVSLAHAVELLRPEYEGWVAGLGIRDADDAAVARTWAGLSTGRDREIMEVVPDEVLARSAHEALRSADGYLRDAAMMFRPWEFDVRDVPCPVLVRHGGADESASPRNAAWLAEHVPGATLALSPTESHLAALHDHWEEVLTWPGG